MGATSDSFIDSLARLSWFHAIGQPLQEEGVIRIDCWNDWPGPEDPRVDAFFSEHQHFKDELESSLGDRRAELEALWDEIQRRVLETAGPIAGYDEAQDAWHGPSTATLHAAWIAGLVAWYQAVERSIPDFIAQQWAWFGRGRWPAGFASIDRWNNKGQGLLVL